MGRAGAVGERSPHIWLSALQFLLRPSDKKEKRPDCWKERCGFVWLEKKGAHTGHKEISARAARPSPNAHPALFPRNFSFFSPFFLFSTMIFFGMLCRAKRKKPKNPKSFHSCPDRVVLLGGRSHAPPTLSVSRRAPLGAGFTCYSVGFCLSPCLFRPQGPQNHTRRALRMRFLSRGIGFTQPSSVTL